MAFPLLSYIESLGIFHPEDLLASKVRARAALVAPRLVVLFSHANATPPPPLTYVNAKTQTHVAGDAKLDQHDRLRHRLDGPGADGGDGGAARRCCEPTLRAL